MMRLADRAILARGWRRWLMAFAAGAVGALAMPPFGFLPALVLSLAPAIWLLDGTIRDGPSSIGPTSGIHSWDPSDAPLFEPRVVERDPEGRTTRSRWAPFKSAALLGWFWGFGYFVAGLWWLGAAFLVEADQFAWAMPFGVLGLPAVLAVYMAFGFAVARLLWAPGAIRILSLAIGLAASEALRGVLFTGFPWNAVGMALGQ